MPGKAKAKALTRGPLRFRQPGSLGLELVDATGRTQVALHIRAGSKEAVQCLADRLGKVLVEEMKHPKCLRTSERSRPPRRRAPACPC